MAPSNKELSEGEFNQRFNMVTQAIGLLPLETRKEVLGYDSFQIQIQEEKKSLGAASREVLRTLDRFSRMMVLEHEIVSTRLTGVVIKTSGDFTTANLETTLNSQQVSNTTWLPTRSSRLSFSSARSLAEPFSDLETALHRALQVSSDKPTQPEKQLLEHIANLLQLMQQNMERPRNSFETQHAAESESEDSTVSPQYLLALYQTVAQRRKTHKHLGALDTALFQLEKVVSEESEREKECPDKPSKVGGPHTTVLPSKTAGGINLIMSQFSYFDLPMENHHEPLGSAAQAALTGRAPLTFVAFAQLLFYFLNTLKACLRFLKNLKEDLRQKRPLCSGMQIWFATRGLNLFLRATDDEAVDMEPFFEEWKKRCPGPSSSPCSSKQTSTKPADKSLVSEPFRSSRPTGSGDNLLEISKSTEVVVDSTDVLAAPQQAVGQRQAPDSSAEGFTDSDDEDPEADLDRLAEEATSEHEDQKPEFARRRPFNERTSLERALWLLCDPLDSARQASKASANSIPSAALQHMDSITLIHTDHVRPFPRRFDFREAVRYAEGQQNSSFVGQLSEERLEAAILNLNPSFKPGGNQAKSTSLNGGGHCELCHSWSHDQDNKVSQASRRYTVFVGVSKRCCFVCMWVLRRMKMKASGLHPNVTGCILPANLPTTIKDEAMKHFSQVLIQGVLKISEEYFIKSQAIPKPDSAPPSDAEDEDHKDVWDIGAEISFGKTLQRRA